MKAFSFFPMIWKFFQISHCCSFSKVIWKLFCQQLFILKLSINLNTFSTSFPSALIVLQIILFSHNTTTHNTFQTLTNCVNATKSSTPLLENPQWILFHTCPQQWKYSSIEKNRKPFRKIYNLKKIVVKWCRLSRINFCLPHQTIARVNRENFDLPVIADRVFRAGKLFSSLHSEKKEKKKHPRRGSIEKIIFLWQCVSLCINREKKRNEKMFTDVSESRDQDVWVAFQSCL